MCRALAKIGAKIELTFKHLYGAKLMSYLNSESCMMVLVKVSADLHRAVNEYKDKVAAVHHTDI